MTVKASFALAAGERSIHDEKRGTEIGDLKPRLVANAEGSMLQAFPRRVPPLDRPAVGQARP